MQTETRPGGLGRVKGFISVFIATLQTFTAEPIGPNDEPLFYTGKKTGTAARPFETMGVVWCRSYSIM